MKDIITQLNITEDGSEIESPSTDVNVINIYHCDYEPTYKGETYADYYARLVKEGFDEYKEVDDKYEGDEINIYLRPTPQHLWWCRCDQLRKWLPACRVYPLPQEL